MDTTVSNIPSQPQQPVQQPVVQQASPPVSVTSIGNKEIGPVQTAAVEEQSVTEIEKPIEASVEAVPTVAEVSVEKGLENVIEKSADQDKPELSKSVQNAGVTFSGPGIPINENSFNVKAMPMTYQQAVAEEKLHPKLDDSKHWLSELVIYVWRKLDPTIGKKAKK